ncbi:uroporphyrinogen decarboxylase family protein [Planctomycetota bacterium]
MAMTKKENLLTALKGQVPEQVPVAPLIHWRFTEKLLGKYHWKDTIDAHRAVGSTWFRGPIAIGPNSDYAPRWKMELREIPSSGIDKKYERIISNSKGTITGKHTIGFAPDDPTLGFEYEYFVKEKKDWDVVMQYWQDQIEQAPMPEHEEIDQAYEYMGDGGVASVVMNSAFTRLCLMRGMENMMLDMFDMPELIHELMDLSLEITKKEVESFLESKGEAFVYDICWMTGMGISPEMFREWLFPEMQQVCDMVRQGGKLVGFYTLGKMRKLLPTVVDSKPHFVMNFEQNEGDITLGEAKKKYGRQICLLGNVDPLILQDGSVEDARRAAKHCLKEAMEGGGYVLSSGDEVPPTAKLDNLKAMVEIAEKYGRY